MQQFFQFLADYSIIETLLAIGVVCLAIDCNSLHSQIKSLQWRIGMLEPAPSINPAMSGTTAAETASQQHSVAITTLYGRGCEST